MQVDLGRLGFRPDEVAVVSGAAHGIGRATAVMLAGFGVTVAAWDREEGPLEEVISEIREAGGAAHAVVAELTEQDSIDKAWKRTAAIGGPVRYLVNNAGPPASTDLSVVDGVRIAIGMYAAVTEGWLKAYSENASSVTFTSSVAGTLSSGGSISAWYPTAKAAIVGYMRYLAVKHRGHPRANSVAPGVIATRRTLAQLSTSEGRRRMQDQPSGRPGDPGEVAAVICFLLSPAASFVNGVMIPVDGGASLTNG